VSALELIFAWIDGRIESLLTTSSPDIALFRVRDRDDREKFYMANAHSLADKVRCTRLLLACDPPPSWLEVKAKTIELWPELADLQDPSRKSWDRARQEGGCAALRSPPRGRPAGRQTRRRRRRKMGQKSPKLAVF
jgi:hypothetical protein